MAPSSLPEAAEAARLRECACFVGARFFAAPIQTRKKEETHAPQGPRLNEAITAKFIRLVTDGGHAIVSRQEAIDRAKKLDLDLVEVQRTSKPPVCKIMDYHKEKYKKETMEKDRAKVKSESTIRKGNFKEVRLKGNIEQKDIEVKAEAVKGLIERGYRVKCMALPSKQRGSEECDLGALLSRLTDLIEDVMVIESGPFVEKQQAYAVVRHVKFGSKKGSGKKENRAQSISETEDNSAIKMAVDGATTGAEALGVQNVDVETDDDVFSDVPNLPSSATGNLLASNSRERSPSSSSMRGQMDKHASPDHSVFRSDSSAEDSNRYSRKPETKFRPDQIKAGGRNLMVNKASTSAECSEFFLRNESNRFGKSPVTASLQGTEQQRLNQGQRSNQDKQPSPPYENKKREQLELKQDHVPAHVSSPAPSYGIFSSPRPSTSNTRQTEDNDLDTQKIPLSHNSAPGMRNRKVENIGEETKQGGWGIFSQSVSNPSQNQKSSSGQR